MIGTILKFCKDILLPSYAKAKLCPDCGDVDGDPCKVSAACQKLGTMSGKHVWIGTCGLSHYGFMADRYQVQA